jgi:hypothetical protein
MSEWSDSLHHGYADPSPDAFGLDRSQPLHVDFKRVGADYLPVCERLIDILTAAGKTV